MNRKLIKDLDTDESDDLSAVNMVTLKEFSNGTPLKDTDLQDKFNAKNSKQQCFAHLEANYDNLISYEDAKRNFTSRKQTFPMETALDMGNHTIFNVKDPTVSDQGANTKYVDSETGKNATKVNQLASSTNSKFTTAQNERNQKADKTYVNTTFLKLSGGTMTGPIHMNGEKITDLKTPTLDTDAATKKFVADEVEKTKDSIIDSHSLKDEIRYIMEDADESSSQSNIELGGIVDLSKSPHKHNKKPIISN